MAIRDSYFGSRCKAILFNIVLLNTHTHVLQLDRVEQGWVGVLWLNTFPVMLHRPFFFPTTGSLRLRTCVWVLIRCSPHGCEGHECKCCGEGFEPHSGDEE